MTGVLGCIKCIEASGFEELAESLTIPVESPFDDDLSGAEREALKTKALLAGRFGVPLEQVDVTIRAGRDGIMEVGSATIFLTARQLRTLK